ncbi:hypothetical protein ACIBQ1_37995 [Nonomuraea sp. NPDC050153]
MSRGTAGAVGFTVLTRCPALPTLDPADARRLYELTRHLHG